MWSSNVFPTCSYFANFSWSRLFRVQIFHAPGFSGFKPFRVHIFLGSVFHCPHSGHRSRFEVPLPVTQPRSRSQEQAFVTLDIEFCFTFDKSDLKHCKFPKYYDQGYVNDIDIKVESLAKLDQRNTTTAKTTDGNIMSAKYDVITIFLIYGQFGAITKSNSGCMIDNSDLFQ